MKNGYLDGASTKGIEGWAWDETKPDLSVDVNIFVDDVFVAKAPASFYRDDLEQAGYGNGRHGFKYEYPKELSRHEPHVIRVCVVTDRNDIHPSPIVIEPTEAPPVLVELPADIKGQVDAVNDRKISGWALNLAKPNAAVSLLVTDNNVLIARVLANRFRKDLEEAGFGNGRCAFEIDLKERLSPFERHEIHVRSEIDNVDLLGSPASIGTTRVLDASTKEYLADLCAQAKTFGDMSSVIDFMANETTKLMRRLTELHGKRFERRDYQQFLDRWRKRLPDAEAAVATNTAPRQILRALIIDDNTPKPNQDAGSNAILSHALSLQRLGYEVVFAPAMEMGTDGIDASLLETLNIFRCGPPFYITVEDILSTQAGEFDLIYLHRVQNAAKYGQLARSYCPKAVQIYSVADLHHIRVARQAKIEDRPELEAVSNRLKQAELLAAVAADAVITHSTFEAGLLSKFIPARKIHIIPWAVEPKPVKTPFEQRSGVAFIGGYSHQPNVDAALWLSSEIIPAVRKIDPSIKCLLVGSNMPDSLKGLEAEGIEPVGYVEDIASIFERVRLTVAPLAFGAGVKGKVLESLAAGVPCVCTSIAAEGLPLPDPLQALIADDAEGIAIRIHRFYNDEIANQMCRDAGLEFIATAFSNDAIDGLISKAIGIKPKVF